MSVVGKVGRRGVGWGAWLAVGLGCWPLLGSAAMPVVDVRAIGQLVEQLRITRDQLTSLRRQVEALTGERGFGNAVPTSIAERNYLPDRWSEVQALPRGTGALATAVQRTLTDWRAARATWEASLPAAWQQQLQAVREPLATAQLLADESYGTASLRFAQLDALRQTIARTQDSKGIAELMARIAVEESMLQNEANKLSAQQAAQGAEAQRREQLNREAVLQGIGRARDLPVVNY